MNLYFCLTEREKRGSIYKFEGCCEAEVFCLYVFVFVEIVILCDEKLCLVFTMLLTLIYGREGNPHTHTTECCLLLSKRRESLYHHQGSVKEEER